MPFESVYTEVTVPATVCGDVAVSPAKVNVTVAPVVIAKALEPVTVNTEVLPGIRFPNDDWLIEIDGATGPDELDSAAPASPMPRAPTDVVVVPPSGLRTVTVSWWAVTPAWTVTEKVMLVALLITVFDTLSPAAPVKVRAALRSGTVVTCDNTSAVPLIEETVDPEYTPVPLTTRPGRTTPLAEV